MKQVVDHFMELSASERKRLLEEHRQKSEWVLKYQEEYVREQIKKEGREEEVKEGRLEGQQEVALKMLKKQMPLSAVLEFTSLSEEELKQLKKQI